MSRQIVLLALGVLSIGLVVAMFRRRPKTKPTPVADLTDVRLPDARIGDTVSIVGLGDDFDDLDFQIDRRHRYEAGDESWYEVSGEYRGTRLFVEFIQDDHLEITVNRESTPRSLAEVGLDEETLIRMDEERRETNSFEWDGQRWHYQESGEVGFFANERGAGEGYYGWDFRGADGRRLSVEKWEDEPFQVHVANVVREEDVRVFRR